MHSVTFFRRKFTPPWWATILTGCAFILLLILGIWQINRGLAKAELVRQHAAQRQQEPQIWQPGHSWPNPYTQLQVTGHFLPHTFLLDNQYRHHQWGYDVLTPLRVVGGNVVIVDRGWVLGDPMRQHFPRPPLITGVQQLRGYAYYPSAKHWAIGPIMEKKGSELTVLEQIDTKIIAQILHNSVYPFIIRLEPNNSHGFDRDWAIVAMPPTRHYGYAVQWFGLALTVIILYIVLNLHKSGN